MTDALVPRAAPIVGEVLPPAVWSPDAHRTDEQLIAMWLHGRPEETVRAYERDVTLFRETVGKPLREVSAADLQAFVDLLEQAGKKPASRARTVSAIRSLLSYCHRLGALTYNIGAAVRSPKVPNELAARILPESVVQRILALTTEPKEHALIRSFYASGGRISEVVGKRGIRWRHLTPAEDEKGGGFLAFTDTKSGQPRTIRVSAETWRLLMAIRPEAATDDDIVFAMGLSTARRIVLRAARRAGVMRNVSPHWFRHAHGSHALEKGANPALVRDTLGHASLATTSKYLHARPGESSSSYLAV